MGPVAIKARKGEVINIPSAPLKGYATDDDGRHRYRDHRFAGPVKDVWVWPTGTATIGTRTVWERIMVKDWDFAPGRASEVINEIPRLTEKEKDDLLAKYPYVNVLYSKTYTGFGPVNDAANGYYFSYQDATDQPGITGKGPTANPASLFPDHQFIEYKNSSGQFIWYDPSYGRPYQGNDRDERLLAFQRTALAGFFIPLDNVRVYASELSDHRPDEGIEPIVARAVMLMRKIDVNTPLQVYRDTTGRPPS